MKLTWKNKNKDNKKRPLGAISLYPDLPFEHQNDKAEANTTLPHQENGDDALNKDPTDVSVSDDSSDVKKLARSFQAQGNKLAEVTFFFFEKKKRKSTRLVGVEG